jgi:hypothetical protein
VDAVHSLHYQLERQGRAGQGRMRVREGARKRGSEEERSEEEREQEIVKESD